MEHIRRETPHLLLKKQGKERTPAESPVGVIPKKKKKMEVGGRKFSPIERKRKKKRARVLSASGGEKGGKEES